MSAVTTLAATIAAAAGAVALYRYVDRQTKGIRASLREMNEKADKKPIIDYERDPESGVYKPKS